MPVEQIEIISRAPLASLDDIARATWAQFAAGALSEAEATQVAEAIERRRTALRRPAPGFAVVPRVAIIREEARPVASKAPKPAPQLRRNGARQLTLRIPRPATYDRSRSIERRRRLAASSPMPPALAASFTTGEQAVLAIVAIEVREHGSCSRSIGELAARSGTSDSTVKRAVRTAVRLGLLSLQERRQKGRKSLTNVLRIISAEWRSWLEYRLHNTGRSATGRPIGGQKRHPTDKAGFSKMWKRGDRATRSPEIAMAGRSDVANARA